MTALSRDIKPKRGAFKALEKHFFTKEEREGDEEYPKEYYEKSQVKEDVNKKFYPPYDGERDEYEKVSLKGSPWTNWKEPPEVGNNGETGNGSESEACDGRKGKEQRVSEALETKHHKASKGDRKKMATAVISAKMRKRKNSM